MVLSMISSEVPIAFIASSRSCLARRIRVRIVPSGKLKISAISRAFIRSQK